MYRISNTTKINLEKALGISLTEFNAMSAEQERQWIEKKIGGPLVFGKKRRYGIVGRGNPLLARRKIRTLDDMERKSKDLFGI